LETKNPGIGLYLVDMSDSGYSRLEKDFLGNERMVHYNAEGAMIGASAVTREEDGSIRISGDIPMVASTAHESVAAPTVTQAGVAAKAYQSSAKSEEPEKPRFQSETDEPSMSSAKIFSIAVAAFVGAALIALIFINLRGSGSSSSETRSVNSRIQEAPSEPPQDAPQMVRPDEVPSDGDSTPPGDRDRPRIRRNESTDLGRTEPSATPEPDGGITQEDSEPKRRRKPKPAEDPKPDAPKPDSTDPIDLRGDDPPAKTDGTKPDGGKTDLDKPSPDDIH
jgi:hypothetical protein